MFGGLIINNKDKLRFERRWRIGKDEYSKKNREKRKEKRETIVFECAKIS